MPQIIVHNNMKRPIAYSALLLGQGIGQPRLTVARQLIPGANQVDAEEFKQATKKSPVWAKWLEDKAVEVREGGSFADLSEKDAVAVVKDTLNVELLNSWAEDEGRAPVKKAIKNQLRELDKRLPKGKDEEAA
jgi:hypothetical protein